MQKVVLVLEGINAVTGIWVNISSLQNANLLGWPIQVWNIIFFVVFFVGFGALYWSSRNIEKHLYDKIMSDIGNSLQYKTSLQGTIDSVTSQDRIFIIMLTKNMAFQHGHLDFEGLFADRASGVPLNDLMLRNCSKCGKPRNKKSEDKE